MRIGALTLLGIAAGFLASWRLPAPTRAREPAPVGPAKPALAGERLGLFPAAAFRLTTGRCVDCPVPEAALWYFADEPIAVPRERPPVTRADQDGLPLPLVVWVAAPEVVERARLAGPDALRVDGHGTVPLALVPRIPSNRSFVDRSTLAFFARRPLRLRGTTVPGRPAARFVARTIWPEDSRIAADRLRLERLGPREDLSTLVRAQTAGLGPAFVPRLLWERGGPDGRRWAGRPVLPSVLSGAQGDDDGTHAGHLAVATGRFGPGGEWADWLVNNFYPLDQVSEKGIVSAAVPMDNYLMDVNSGQAYYRPVYLLVAVLREADAARQAQAALQETLARYYCHEFRFERATRNSTEMTLEPLRQVGWEIPRAGPTSRLRAPLAFVAGAVAGRSLRRGAEAYGFFTEERTHLFPRTAFEVAGHDLLGLVEGRTTRALTPYERRLARDVDALLFLRVSQIPSSRPFGTFPVASIQEYRERLRARGGDQGHDGAAARPFPARLQETCPAGGRPAGPAAASPPAGSRAAGR